jgi:hypothetical protein
MHATPLVSPRESPLHMSISLCPPAFSPGLAIAAGIRHLSRACSHVAARFFLADAIFDTRYISRHGARAVRQTLLAGIPEVRSHSLPSPLYKQHQAFAAAAGILQLSSRHPGTKTPRRVEETRTPTPRLHIPSFFLREEGILVSRTALLRLSQKPSLSYQSVLSNLHTPRSDHQHKLRHTHTRKLTPQWPSAPVPRPSSGAPATTTTASPRQTPQTPTSDGPATSTSPASPCPGPNTANHQRKSTKSISTRSASPTLGAARVSRASTRPWALARLADSPVRRRAGGAAGTAGRRA